MLALQPEEIVQYVHDLNLSLLFEELVQGLLLPDLMMYKNLARNL
jgi:hypothetical protein